MKPEDPKQKSARDLAARLAALDAEKRLVLDQKVKQSSINGHDLIARSLAAHGVTHVYCVAGTPVVETFAACARAGMRPIGVRHQQTGTMMAAAQNYVSGGLKAISLLSAGPAVTNAATGILVAQDNCWPLLVLGGRRPLAMREMGSFQELDGVALFQSITKYSALVDLTSRLPEYIARACQTAVSGRPGAVYLDVPEDVLTQTTEFVVDVPRAPGEERTLDTAAVGRAAEIVQKAERPALILGKGVRWSEPYEELLTLVNEYRIPFISSPMGRGFIPDDHPLCYNAARNLLQSRADCVVLVGARLDWTFRFGAQFAHDVKLIQVDIHGPEIGRNIKPAVGITGDVKQFLQQLLQCLPAKKAMIAEGQKRRWLEALDEKRQETRRNLESLVDKDTVPMSPHRMLKEVRDSLPKDCIYVLDGNISMAAAQQVLPAYFPASRLTAGTNGCMGVGIPFALGAKLCHPERTVVAVCGDAAFGFNAMEMETAVRHRIPIVVIIANNEGISGSSRQKLFAPAERVTMFQPKTHYEEFVKVLGGHGEFVEHPSQLKAAMDRACRSGKPACINVCIDPDSPYPRD